MELTIFTIAIIGIIIGIFANPIPFFGGTAINFLLTSLLIVYQQLAELVIAIPSIPTKIYIFAIAYAVGLFSVKLGSLIPGPHQPVFLALRGGNQL